MRRPRADGSRAIYRLDHEGNQLVMEGQSGFDPRHLDRARTRPMDGSHLGVAVRTGQILVTHLDVSPPTDEGIREIAVARAHRTQLAVPIPVEQRTWGVMALVSQEKREFSPEEITGLSGVAQQVGLAVERAQLRDTAAARLNRLEAQRVIERHISEQLVTDELLCRDRALGPAPIGGTYAPAVPAGGDVLRPRAWRMSPTGSGSRIETRPAWPVPPWQWPRLAGQRLPELCHGSQSSFRSSSGCSPHPSWRSTARSA